MSKHLFGMILTHEGTFANNRGESEGTATTLQKVLRAGDLYTTVSAESIRYALRQGWQERGRTLNRTSPDAASNQFADNEFENWPDHLDDDVLGFMHARRETIARRSVLEVTRAISTTPWRGELMNNFAGPGSNPAVDSDNPIPYAVEVHHTRYQFGFAMTPAALGREGLPPHAEEHLKPEQKKKRLRWTLKGLQNLRRVGGNHARYFSDFSPEAIILRWTDDPAPRFLYCFEQDEHGELSLESLSERVQENGDIRQDELIVGTHLDISHKDDLAADECTHDSINAAVDQLLAKVTDADLTETADEE